MKNVHHLVNNVLVLDSLRFAVAWSRFWLEEIPVIIIQKLCQWNGVKFKETNLTFAPADIWIESSSASLTGNNP